MALTQHTTLQGVVDTLITDTASDNVMEDTAALAQSTGVHVGVVVECLMKVCGVQATIAALTNCTDGLGGVAVVKDPAVSCCLSTLIH